jgi:hypothetical protein
LEYATYVPALMGVAALLTAVATLISSVYNGRKVQEIHVLVNSKMSEALLTISTLRRQLEGKDVK